MASPNTERILIRVTPEIKAMVDDLCVEREQTPTAFARLALKRELQRIAQNEHGCSCPKL